jgi:hypothetical protein
MKFLPLLAGIMVAAGTTVMASTDARQTPSDGVLIAPRENNGLDDAGLLLLTRSARPRRLLATRWSTVAVAGRDGPFAVERRGPLAERRPLVVVAQGQAREIPDSVDARCVSWSPDRQTLSYLTGTVALLPGSRLGHPTWTIDGTLWLVDLKAPPSPRAIATGVLPLSECPSWAPRGHTLAYVVRAPPAWRLIVWRDGRSRAIADRDQVSVAYRMFDWAPRSQQLVFLDGSALFRWSSGKPMRVTSAAALAGVGVDASDRFLHSLRFSPDGRLIAVAIGGETAILASGGRFVRKVPGTLNGWAGDGGVLTLRGELHGVTLRLYPVDGSRPNRVISLHFKYYVVSDPNGHWFAYASPHAVYFRRPDGSLLRRVPFASFFPWVLAGFTADGRVIEPISAY